MFHIYFVGSAEGLLFDVPRDDYDTTLWAPLGALPARPRRLGGHRARGALGRRARRRHRGAARRCSATTTRTGSRPMPSCWRSTRCGLRRVVAASPGLGGDDDAGAAWRESVAGIRSAPSFAVWRLWLTGTVAPERPAVPRHERLRAARQRLGARAVRGPRDPVERRRTTARSSSCTRTPCPRAPPRSTCASGCSPRCTGSTPRRRPSSVVHDEWLVAADCVLVGLEPWRSRPGVRTPDPRVLLAGDAVRCDLPGGAHGARGDDRLDGGRPPAQRLGPARARRVVGADGVAARAGSAAGAPRHPGLPRRRRRGAARRAGPRRRRSSAHSWVADARMPTLTSGARPRATRNPNRSDVRDDGLGHHRARGVHPGRGAAGSRGSRRRCRCPRRRRSS